MVFFGSSSCLSLLFGRLACISFFSSSSSLFLLFSCGFRFFFSFRWALYRLSLRFRSGAFYRGVLLHKCLSAFCPPLFSVPLVISPLALLPFLRSSCGYLFCPFSYGVFCFSTSSFGGFGLLHSPAYSSPSACSLGVHCPSVLPSSGVSIGWGRLYTLGYAQVLPQAPIGVSSLSTASPLLSVRHPAVPSSSLPAFQPQGFSGFYPPASSLLPSYSLTWPVSSAPGLGSPPLVSVVPCLPAVLYLALRYFLLPLFALLLLAPLRVSMALHLRCLGLLRLIVYLQFAPGRSRVFSGLFS